MLHNIEQDRTHRPTEPLAHNSKVSQVRMLISLWYFFFYVFCFQDPPAHWVPRPQLRSVASADAHQSTTASCRPFENRGTSGEESSTWELSGEGFALDSADSCRFGYAPGERGRGSPHVCWGGSGMSVGLFNRSLLTHVHTLIGLFWHMYIP